MIPQTTEISASLCLSISLVGPTAPHPHSPSYHPAGVWLSGLCPSVSSQLLYDRAAIRRIQQGRGWHAVLFQSLVCIDKKFSNRSWKTSLKLLVWTTSPGNIRHLPPLPQALKTSCSRWVESAWRVNTDIPLVVWVPSPGQRQLPGLLAAQLTEITSEQQLQLSADTS